MIIIAVCFVIGVVGGFLTDKIIKKTNLQTDRSCKIEVHHEEAEFHHFLKGHVYDHILKRYFPRLFLLIFVRSTFGSSSLLSLW